MKKITVLVLGFVTLISLTGCSKKQAQAPVEEPIVTEETTATAVANMEPTSNMMNAASPVAASEPSALEAATSAVAQTVAAVVENPTPQQIQEALKQAGYYEGKVDGTIGPKTKRAIEKFQKDNGLKADGKVGPRTWAKLATHLTAVAGEAAAAAVAPATEPILNADTSASGSQTVVK